MRADETCPHAARDVASTSLLHAWAAALAGPASAAALRHRLAPLADGLLAAAKGHAALSIARTVGAALVAPDLDGPGALERTLGVLQRELAGHRRGPDVIAALAAGYAGAVRDRAPPRSPATRGRTPPASVPSSAIPPPGS